MKKTMILLLAAVLLVGCAGCTGQPAGGGQTASTPTPAPSPTAEPDLIQLTEPDPQDEPDPQPLTEPDPASESEPLPFVHMEFCSAGMTVGETVIEVTKTQKGAALSKYTRWTYWDSDKQEEIEEKQIIREMEAGQDMYDQIAAEAGKYGAASWDGFSESDPNVLDGETFRFEAELEDGTMLHAYGSNAFPDGYRAMVKYLEDIMEAGPVTDTVYEREGFSLTLPESWVGEAEILYDVYGRESFYLPVEDAQLPLMDVCTDDYYFWAAPEYRIGQLVSAEKTICLCVFPGEETVEDGVWKNRKLTAAQDAVCSTLSADIAAILESLTPTEGYEFVPEDGSILYREDARDLFEDARSQWLNLFLGGEYPSGTTQTKLNGRTYRTVSASYDTDKIRTVEDCRRKMRQVFTEEYTDALITQMLQNHDLEEYNGQLYVPMNRVQDPYRYGSYQIDRIDQDGTEARLVLQVGKAAPTDEQYSYSETEEVIFSLEQEDDGSWRFSDFPYWDK